MSSVALVPGFLLEEKYKIVGVIGQGAWGEVFEGVNVRIQRRVAIKVLKAEYASNESMVSRFEREALGSTHIDSPHVVQVFDAGVLADGRPYLVMEFLTGEDLGVLIANSGGRIPIINAVDLCAQAARGLAAAHAENVFHRDMKPTNIMVVRTKAGSETAKIVDFGISKLLDVSDESISKTQTGTVLGSPVYMSPEQARGSKATDHRSDIYSLGVVLYECLSGTTPHTADGFNELLFKIVLEDMPSVRTHRPEVDEELDAILRHTLAKVPDQRVQTATELEGLLVAWLEKQGAKLGESRSDSGLHRFSLGTRGLPNLSASIDDERAGSSGSMPVVKSRPGELNVTVTVDGRYGTTPTSASPFVTPLVNAEAAGVAETVPAPPQARSGAGLSSLGAVNSTTTVRPPQRWGYPVAAVAVLVVLGVVGVMAVDGRRAAGTAAHAPALGASALEPHASATPAADAITTAPRVERGLTVAAVATASATSGDRASPPDATSGHPAPAGRWPVGTAVRPKGSAPAAASAPQSSASVPGAPSAASSTNPASVGGRTIRTDL